MSIPTCDEKLDLLIEYQRLNRAYTVALGNMAVTDPSCADYDKLCAGVEEARIASLDAKRELDRHIAEHGC